LKSLLLLFQDILFEIEDRCHTRSALRDLKTVTKRVENEGLSFLTITLPTFAKDLEKGLEQGFVDRNLFSGFTFQAGTPQLFGGFLDLIFDRCDGRLLDNPNVDAIRGLRQLTLMFSKIKLRCAPERELNAIRKYIQCEEEVRASDRSFEAHKADFERIGAMLFSQVFTEIDREVYYGNIRPKHGSGSTADRLRGNSKYLQVEWTSRLEKTFPMSENVFHSYSAYLAKYDQLSILEPGEERPVKVVLVPKTLKTPRVIAMEPTCMQYMQQALLETIVEKLERDDILSNLISWKSQIPNQDLALLGSQFGDLATLDMSEASDRVSNQHVRSLLHRFPSFLEGVDATRSRKADVPGFGVLRLAKFASMGSALCFPFEAMVFLTVIFLGIERKLNLPLTRKTIKGLVGKVRVYGDDIIVPTDFVDSVIATLEDFGLKVNSNKSFWKGKFRESCGKDYYNGDDVSVVRLRSLFPTSRKDTSEIVSTVEFRNHLYKAGYWTAVRRLDQWIEELIPFPAVLTESQGLGRFSFLGHSEERWHPTLHHPLVKAGVIKVKLPKSDISDEGNAALTKFFLKRGDLPFADREHLVYSGRPVTIDINYRWVRPF